MSQIKILDIFKDKQPLKCHNLILDVCACGKIIQIYSYIGADVAQVGRSVGALIWRLVVHSHFRKVDFTHQTFG